ncbi:F-box/LRR-repeat protein 17 isoform X2 [Mixophyes fleayi]|uniref:F-box/LRR-repeat protein 17 isoform X2 n=1 Tax=Mixophyes fleayi TaxID=3061075 RepID=UPI003F4D81DB
MGSLLCKQRSGHTPHRPESRRKKLQRGDCFFRAPCMLCFIVHNHRRERPSSQPTSPDLPAARTAAQDCARLLLLCPVELSAWQDRRRSLLCTGYLRGPEFRTVTSPQPCCSNLAADMVCKRKNCGGNQKPRTPCKLPRCAPAREQAHSPSGDPPDSCVEKQTQHCSEGQAQHPFPGGLTHPLAEEQAPHFSGSQSPPCSNEEQLNGDSATLSTEGSVYQLTGDPTQSCTEELTHQLTGDPAIPFPEEETQPLTSDNLQQNTVQQGHALSDESDPQNDKVLCCTSSCLDSSYLLPTPLQVQPQCLSCRIREADPENHNVETDVAIPCEQFHINQLPPSLLLKIFSHLSLNERCLAASLVCKYWHDLCLDFQFWKQLDLSSREQVRDGLLERIASRCWKISEFNISDCLNVTDGGICMFAQKCSGLVKYTAYRCKQLSDLSLISLATHCLSLQKVHVGNQDRLTDEALKQLGSRCRDLRDIHFGQCYKISDEGMIVIAKGCPKLQKIYMQENKLVSDTSVEAFAEHCPELQYVGFMGCSVTSKGVIRLTNLKKLSSLDLRHINELDNETVMEIVKKCRNLTSLNLCLNRNIDDSSGQVEASTATLNKRKRSGVPSQVPIERVHQQRKLPR